MYYDLAAVGLIEVDVLDVAEYEPIPVLVVSEASKRVYVCVKLGGIRNS